MAHCSEMSLPVRGAWIEMGRSWPVCLCPVRRSPCGERGLKCKAGHPARNCAGSLPVRGAWIEIYGDTVAVCPRMSLPVRGAWIEMDNANANARAVIVAPRAGSVD